MPTIKGFTTKKKGWEKDVIQAIKDSPDSKLKLPFKATNLKTASDILGDVRVEDSSGKKMQVRKKSWLRRFLRL